MRGRKRQRRSTCLSQSIDFTSDARYVLMSSILHLKQALLLRRLSTVQLTPNQRCSGEITFKTDPKNMDYVCERGAKRNFEPWRDRSADNQNETEQEILDRLEREENEEREQLERDKMAELEEKMLDSKREMAVADALDEIRTRNARIERGEARGEESALAQVRDEVDEARLQAEREDEEAARRAFMTATGEKVKRLVEDDEADKPDGTPKPAPAPSFARTKKPKKPFSAGLGIKKKTSLV